MSIEKQGFLIKKGNKIIVDSNKTDSIILNKLQVDFINESKKYLKGKLLDAGCGEKPYSIIYNDCVDKVIGCDVPYCIHNQQFIDVYATLDELPFPEGEFDTILCTNVLEHVENVEGAFKEISRVLKKSGTFILTVPFLYPLHEAPYDFQRFTYYGLENKLKKNGMKIEEIYPWGSAGMLFVVYINLFVCKFLKWQFLKGLNRVCQNIFYYIYQKLCINRVIKGKCKLAKIISLGYFVVASKL